MIRRKRDKNIVKVAVITIYDLMNYGNRLQNYATNYYLQKNNIQVETLVIEYSTISGKIKQSIKKLLHKPIYVNWSMRQETPEFIAKLSECEKNRYNKFKEFSYKYTNIQYRKYTKFCKNFWVNEYDFFIVGSDQVWNPNIDQAKDWEFLCFAPQGKRISWSASFGIKAILDPKGKIRNGLNKMDYISVREESGVEIVHKLSNKEAVTLIDPTLMLNEKEWSEISQKPHNMSDDEEYILLFFLGEVTENIKKESNDISNHYGYQVINLMDKKCKVYESGPSEFIYLISHAKLVLTDSFHASVFSFIFDKPFIVYDRKWEQGDMNSRLETLLKTFHLERKYYNSGMENDLWEHDYAEGYRQLELERRKTVTFLGNALKITDV